MEGPRSLDTMCARVDDGVVVVLDGHGAQDMAKLLPAMYTSAMAVLIQMEMESAATIQSFTPRSKITWKLGRLARSRPRAGLFHSLGGGYTSSTSLPARYRSNQRGSRPCFGPVGGGKAGEIGARHGAQFAHLGLGHAGIAEAGDIKVQLFGRVEPELGAEGGLILVITPEFGAQEIHHHCAGDRAVFSCMPWAARGGGGGPQQVCTHFFGVAAHVEPVALSWVSLSICSSEGLRSC